MSTRAAITQAQIGSGGPDLPGLIGSRRHQRERAYAGNTKAPTTVRPTAIVGENRRRADGLA